MIVCDCSVELNMQCIFKYFYQINVGCIYIYIYIYIYICMSKLRLLINIIYVTNKMRTIYIISC